MQMEGNLRDIFCNLYCQTGCGQPQGKSGPGNQLGDNAGIDRRRKPKEMEWIYLIQVKSRKLPKGKEAQMSRTSSKCGSQTQGSGVSKTERKRGLRSGGIWGQCCEVMIPQQRNCSNSQGEAESQADVPPVHTKRGETKFVLLPKD